MSRLLALVCVCVTGRGVWAAAPDEATVRVTATATSSMAKFPPWRAIGQVTAQRWGWCPDHGDGVGESITFAFDDALPITELRIVAGLQPDWGTRNEIDHGLPDRIEVKTDSQTLEATLHRGETGFGGDNRVALSGAPIRSVSLKILSVKPGKVAHTCINGVHFHAAKLSYVAVYGFEAALMKALPRFATALDAAFKSCDPIVLGASIRFPLQHQHDVIVPMGGGDDHQSKTVTYKSIQDLVQACRRRDSILQLGLAGLVGRGDDVDVADDIAHAFSETAGEVRIGDWQTHAWWLRASGTWQLTQLLTSDERMADAASAIGELASDQIDAWNHDKRDPGMAFTPDATLVLVQPKAGIVKATDAAAALPGVLGATSHTEASVAVTLARDRRTAALSFVASLHGAKDVEYRVSEVVVRSEGYWKIAAGMWSEPKPNDAVNKAAIAGTIAAFARVAPPNAVTLDPLTSAFFAMQKGAVDPVAAARSDLVVFGSGPGERTVGGARFAKPWLAAWANHVPLDAGVVSRLAPTGTTGWVVTDIMLEKHDPKSRNLYLIPFRIFLMFDKTIDGAWSLLHAQFATVAP